MPSIGNLTAVYRGLCLQGGAGGQILSALAWVQVGLASDYSGVRFLQVMPKAVPCFCHVHLGLRNDYARSHAAADCMPCGMQCEKVINP